MRELISHPQDQERLEKFISESIDVRNLSATILSTLLGIVAVNSATSLMMYLGLGLLSAASLNCLVIIAFVANAVSKMSYRDKHFKITNGSVLAGIQALSIAIASWVSFSEYREVRSMSESGKKLFLQEVERYYPSHKQQKSNDILAVGSLGVVISLILATIVCRKSQN